MENNRGFTLVEMIVATALFAIVMVVSTGALLALVGANRKAQALQSVINNLNIALDGMVRSLRMGNTYRCGGTNPSNTDCPEGDRVIYFEAYGGDPSDSSDDWAYLFDTSGNYCGENRLCKSENDGEDFFALTAPEVTIDAMTFYVIGTTRGASDAQNLQPKVVVTVKGTAGALNIKTRTTFNIQATAVQRLLDL